VRRLKTFEEVAWDFNNPEDRYRKNKNQKQMHRFKVKFPNPERRGEVVAAKYGRVHKEWYGWSKYQKEKVIYLRENMQELALLYSCGAFEALEDGFEYDSDNKD
jgi:hypothetical protein